MKVGILTLGVWLSLAVGQLQAEVYRWVDENGKVHFGDRPPTGQKTDTLDLPKVAPESEAPHVSEEESKLRQKKLVRMLEEERLAKEEAKREVAQKAEEKAKYCERFKNRLTYLDRYTHIYNEREDGTREYMSDDEMDAYRARIKAQYRKECPEN